jgi:hypothetical protein
VNDMLLAIQLRRSKKISFWDAMLYSMVRGPFRRAGVGWFGVPQSFLTATCFYRYCIGNLAAYVVVIHAPGQFPSRPSSHSHPSHLSMSSPPTHRSLSTKPARSPYV